MCSVNNKTEGVMTNDGSLLCPILQNGGCLSCTVLCLLPYMATSRQFSVLSDDETIKCRGHVCLVTQIFNQFRVEVHTGLHTLHIAITISIPHGLLCEVHR